MTALTPCVETTRCRDPKGYGRCSVNRFGQKIRSAHRLAWVDHHGRMPAEGMQINHHCDNPPCINVEHLYEGTVQQNSDDMVRRGRAPKCKAAQINAAKTHCRNGHPFSEDNTYTWTGGKHKLMRQCRACRQDADHRRRPVPAQRRLNPACPQGHLFDEVNTKFNKHGARICITCTRASGRASAARRRARLKAVAPHCPAAHYAQAV